MVSIFPIYSLLNRGAKELLRVSQPNDRPSSPAISGLNAPGSAAREARLAGDAKLAMDPSRAVACSGSWAWRGDLGEHGKLLWMEEILHQLKTVD